VFAKDSGKRGMEVTAKVSFFIAMKIFWNEIVTNNCTQRYTQQHRIV
jgi:hypothetical protein